jgi:tRNA threonylcarbamoyladenosine biosynthesis protein TsaB
LNFAGEDLKNIDVFAVSCGPGSFMGVRVGMSVAKGFAVVESRPIAAVSTLRGLAENVAVLQFESPVIVCATLDARCENVYAGIWQLAGGVSVPLCAEKLINVGVLESDLNILQAQLQLPIILTGGGFISRGRIVSRTIKANEPILDPNAISICKLAENRDLWCAADAATPIYLKNL